MRSLGLAIIQHDSCLHKGEIWTETDTPWRKMIWKDMKAGKRWLLTSLWENQEFTVKYIHIQKVFFLLEKRNEWENIYNFAIDNIVQHFKDKFKTTTSCYRSTSLKYHLNLINYHCINSNGPDLALKPAMIHWRKCENQMGLFQE